MAKSLLWAAIPYNQGSQIDRGMGKMRTALFLTVLAITSVPCVAPDAAGEPRTERDRTIVAIIEMDGTVRFDEKEPDKPVIGVKVFGEKVDDALLERLGELTSLRTLDFNKSAHALEGQYTPFVIAGLVAAPESTQITDAGLQHLRRLRQLRELYLVGPQVTDVGMPNLASLNELQSLDIGGTGVTDDGLEFLTRLPHLRWLLLGMKTTDAGLEHLQSLKQLHTLDLSETNVTDDGLEHLEGLGQLRALGLPSP